MYARFGGTVCRPQTAANSDPSTLRLCGASLRISPADSRSALPRSRPQIGSSSNLPVPTINRRLRIQIFANVPISQFKTLRSEYFETIAEYLGAFAKPATMASGAAGMTFPRVHLICAKRGMKCSHLGMKFFISIANRTNILDWMSVIICRNPQPARMQICSKVKSRDTTKISRQN